MADLTDPNLKPQDPQTAKPAKAEPRENPDHLKDGRKVLVVTPDGRRVPGKLVAVYRENPTIAVELECGEESFADVPAWNGNGAPPGFRVWILPK